MMQTGEHIPKPTDDEIARVEAWQRVARFKEAEDCAQSIRLTVNYTSLRFMGEIIDERFSKLALIGLIYHFARKAEQ